ncbi:MAG: hypothetical protein O3B13_08785 [Planctomycetota bacterium]|nr:hypothetical protein [Planctomycetota bacterium]MDA1163183.1 hypothetical protein [Planctomycetota bacterium]
MAELTQAFVIWLLGFGTVSIGALVALHVVLRKLRSSSRTVTSIGGQQPSTGRTRLSLFRRLMITGMVGGFYVVVLGPLAGSVLTYLNESSPAAVTTHHEAGNGLHPQLATATLELDRFGRPRLIPVPDPISVR